PFSLDIDGNGAIDGLTDGFLLLRYEFGFRGNALIDGAIGFGALRPNAASIEEYLEEAGPQLDLDGNGSVDALRDGIMALRFMFGFTGNELVNGLLGSDATRDASQIEALLQSYSI
ncbi:MAG: N-acetylgalactosamine 6-sulfatase (GALNS), partial [Hormoscilla sp.]